jgi:hypothetical protein
VLGRALSNGPLLRGLPKPPLLLLVAFVAVAGALAAIAAGGGDAGVAAGSLLVIWTCLPTISRLRRDLLDGPGIYAAVSAVMFGALSFVWLGTPVTPPPGIGVDQVADALLLVAAGLAAFGIAARLVGRSAPRPELKFSREAVPSRRVIAATFAVGAVGAAVGLAIGAVGYGASSNPSRQVLAGSQVLTQLSGLGALVVLATAIAYFGTASRGYGRFLLVLTLMQAAVGFAVGFKGLSLAPLVFVCLAFIACRRRVPLRLIGVGLLVAAVLVPTVSFYRATIRPTRGAVPVPLFTRVAHQARFYATARFRLIDHVALIQARTPSVYERGDGSRYLLLPALVVVPRALWPDKPVLEEGIEFSRTYWEIPPAVRTSTPPTQIGDLYRNFGVPGVLVGLFAWGAVVAGFTRLCRRWRSARLEMIYLVAVLFWIPFVEAVLPELIATVSKGLPVAAAVAWFLLPGRSSPPGYRRVEEYAHEAGKAARRRLRRDRAAGAHA